MPFPKCLSFSWHHNLLNNPKFTSFVAHASKFRRFCLGSILISVAYFDPGNYSTNITAGATNRFSLLCVVLLSNLIAIFLQSLCIKLGSVTGMDLPNACRIHLNKYVNWGLYIAAECAIIATDLAEVIGTAIALNILLKIPLPAGVVLTIVDVFVVLLAYRPGGSAQLIRYIEYVVAVFVAGVVVCFCIELKMIPPVPIRQVFRGFIPSSQMFEHSGMYTATSILGATVMPHSLILGTSLVKPRLREFDEQQNFIKEEWFSNREEAEEYFYYHYRPTLKAIDYSLKYSIIELTVTLFTVALFVNAAILIIAGAALYGTDEAVDADLYTIHSLLSKLLTPAAGTVFMVALLLSGLMAGVVCTMSGQIVSEGHLNWTIKPWKRRAITRSIAIIPAFIVTLTIGKSGLSKALNASQVCLSILLPFLTAPLIYFTCKKSVMKVEIKDDYVIDIKKSETQQEIISLSDMTSTTTEDDSQSTTTIRQRQGGAAGAAGANTTAPAVPANIDTACPDAEGQVIRIQTTDLSEQRYVDYSNNWVTSIIAAIAWLFVCVLNVYMIVQLGLSGGDIS